MLGQLTTPRGDGAVLSRSIEIDEGARAALIHVPDLFRLDVAAHDDTIRTVVRNLSDGALTMESTGYAGPVAVQGELDRHRPGRHDVRFRLDEPGGAVEVSVLLATLRDGERGVIRFTAHAAVRSA